MSVMPATGNGLGAGDVCVSLRASAWKELALGGTRGVPNIYQRDHGAWVSLGTRPTGMSVSSSESTGETIGDRPLETSGVPASSWCMGLCVCVCMCLSMSEM